MKETLLQLIESFDSIIIGRHKRPDLDAYGSQFGLYYALKNAYPKKNIYKVGDTNIQNYFEALDDLDEDIYKKSLVIILDTVASQMLDEDIHKNYAKLVLIDHHRNDPDIPYDLAFQNVEASSTAEIITELLIDWEIQITPLSARALYMGMIGDTGRFLYQSTTAKTLRLASVLIDCGANIGEIHQTMYTETKETKMMKNIFFNRVKYTDHLVAYSKNDKAFLETYNLTTNFASRGLVNQMAGMQEVKVWANFTFDTETNDILCEFRSRDVPVLPVAKKYGGGGHLHACGCTVNNWEETDLVIQDLNQLLEENNG